MVYPTGQVYGYYDLEFIAKNGSLIKVEIWGEKPKGHAEVHYEYKKRLKLEFNSGDDAFLGINFRDCYVENHLDLILKDYIGNIKPYVFNNSYDDVIPSTHWSNSDELIEYCKDLASRMPDKIFPAEDWLRKRGKWKDRGGETYNTLSIYIKKWVGGIRQLRKIIGQPENSTVKWDKEKAVQEYKNIYNTYGLTTGQIRGQLRRGP